MKLKLTNPISPSKIRSSHPRMQNRILSRNRQSHLLLHLPLRRRRRRLLPFIVATNSLRASSLRQTVEHEGVRVEAQPPPSAPGGDAALDVRHADDRSGRDLVDRLHEQIEAVPAVGRRMRAGIG